MSRYTPRTYDDLDELEDEVLHAEDIQEAKEVIKDPVEIAQLMAWDYSRKLLRARGSYEDVAFSDRATSIPTLVEAYFSNELLRGRKISMHAYVVALEGAAYEQ
jgi:hypothetical protein